MTLSRILRVKLIALFTTIGILVAASSCTLQPRYTSLDIDLMPCERGLDTPKFFRAIEFDKNGGYKYPQQKKELLDYIESSSQITDLIVFNHGWNKSAESAELDYQRFICRLHSELTNYIAGTKRRGGLLIVGVFWPSTITNKPKEPFLLKPISYYNIRSRADSIAKHALASLFADLGNQILSKSGVALEGMNVAPRIHLVGHSFGARMIVRALEELNRREGTASSQLVDFLIVAEYLNVVLLNAAAPKERFDWIAEAIAEAREVQGFSALARFTETTSSYLFNLHSEHDKANKLLFRLASIFNSDSMDCAVGACGIPQYPTLCVDESGEVSAIRKDGVDSSFRQLEGINIWNADTRNIVFSHSDIYKGRVAKLVSNLLYDADLRDAIKQDSVPVVKTVDTCSL